MNTDERVFSMRFTARVLGTRRGRANQRRQNMAETHNASPQWEEFRRQAQLAKKAKLETGPAKNPTRRPNPTRRLSTARQQRLVELLRKGSGLEVATEVVPSLPVEAKHAAQRSALLKELKALVRLSEVLSRRTRKAADKLARLPVIRKLVDL
jgi:hypothetical protein